MTEIIMSTPWRCGHSDDCPVGWHMANYWVCDNGYSVDTYADGDQEDCDEADLPTAEQVDNALKEYGRYVATTGEDPLGEYIVRHTYKRKARFVAEFRNGIGGAILCRWKRGRGAWSAHPPPALLRDYLCLVDDFVTEPNFRRWMLKDYDPKTGERENYSFTEMLALVEDDDNVRLTKPERRFVRLHLVLEETVPRTPSAIARGLSRAAKARS